VLENGRFSMANLTSRLADLYEDRPLCFLDRPLRYPFFEGDEISYRTFDRFVGRIANGLARLGVRRGDRVGLLTLNRIEMAFGLFAIQRLGAIAVPLMAMSKPEEVRYLVEDAGCRVLMTDEPTFDAVIGDRSRLPSVREWILASDGEPPPGFHGLAVLVADAAEECEPAELAPDDVVLIRYSAGTTGRPKGAMLSNAALLFTVRRYMMLSGLAPTSRRALSLLVMPLAHTSGYQAMLVHMVLALPLLFIRSFDPEWLLDLIEGQRVTFFCGVPATYKMLLDAGVDGRDLSSVRVWGGGADVFSLELVETFRRLAARRVLGVTVKPIFVVGYGMAETAGQVSVTFPRPFGDGCLGWSPPGFERRIVDEAGRDVARGEVGELWLRGPLLMSGYWGSPELTAATLRDGWLRTGDLVRSGRAGLLYITSRQKEVIKSGGYSVFPAEAEGQLVAHPQIQEAVVVGIPHEIKGEVPVAAVVPKPGETLDADAVLAWARDRIGSYKCPQQVVVVDAIPLSAVLKPKRIAVREMILKGVLA
jgi:acyl-CoA synthetase (AMP-forming)/AMP-acid ligase II